ncbi:MAG: Mo-dependent nitrogenase C-terminal domain-containing protein [Xenococcaceae cyanobacterium MO_188.B32]|nr:Mo-dependent nitrogenase C-terminal domain-containing protein [Xenococcaceae cyanobacterium MO_188.B32]
MITTLKSSYTDAQIVAWLRGLYTIAWADGNYDPEEEALIAKLTTEIANLDKIADLEPITPEELAISLGKEATTAENFLRTAVLVAVADGVYSPPEYELICKFSDALGVEVEALKSLENTLYRKEEHKAVESTLPLDKQAEHKELLQPVKEWLDGMDVHDPRLARFVCKMIPAQCPFERDINLFGRTIAHIPPLCKLNPLYEQFVGLRFRSLSYLADECGEDVTEYIK